MQEQIEREFGVLSDQFLVLLTMPSKDHDEVVTSLTRFMLQRVAADRKCCYVTVGKPSATLQELFALNGIANTRMLYVDCVSAEREQLKDTATVKYVHSPHDLTAIGIQMNRFLPAKPGAVIFDSLNSLLLHNSRSDVLRFIHQFTSFVRTNKLAGVLLALAEDSDVALLSSIGQFCDTQVELVMQKH